MIEHNLITEYPSEYKRFIHGLIVSKIREFRRMAYDEVCQGAENDNLGIYKAALLTSEHIIDHAKQQYTADNEALDNSILLCDTIIDFTERFKAHIQKLKAQQCPNS